jgi:hypothetical protein
MHTLCSNCTAMAVYQTASTHSAVTLLEWQDTKLHARTLQQLYCMKFCTLPLHNVTAECVDAVWYPTTAVGLLQCACMQFGILTLQNSY